MKGTSVWQEILVEHEISDVKLGISKKKGRDYILKLHRQYSPLITNTVGITNQFAISNFNGSNNFEK